MSAKADLKQWIDMHARAMEQLSRSSSKSFEAWLAKNGQWWSARELVAKPNVSSRTCYLNAWVLRGKLLRKKRDIAYCEGVVFIDGMIMPVWHGWLVDRDTGDVIDPSVRQNPEFAYCGHAFEDEFANRAWIELLSEGSIGIIGNGWLLKSVDVMAYLNSKETT